MGFGGGEVCGSWRDSRGGLAAVVREYILGIVCHFFSALLAHLFHGSIYADLVYVYSGTNFNRPISFNAPSCFYSIYRLDAAASFDSSASYNPPSFSKKIID